MEQVYTAYTMKFENIIKSSEYANITKIKEQGYNTSIGYYL